MDVLAEFSQPAKTGSVLRKIFRMRGVEADSVLFLDSVDLAEKI